MKYKYKRQINIIEKYRQYDFWRDIDMDRLWEEAMSRQDRLHIPSLRQISVDLYILSDTQIYQLNHTRRGLKKATDVLSFPTYEIHAKHSKVSRLELGQICISLDHTISQAERYGHSREREFAFLWVHGLLHLLGYDHETQSEEREMLALQEDILATVGYVR